MPAVPCMERDDDRSGHGQRLHRIRRVQARTLFKQHFFGELPFLSHTSQHRRASELGTRYLPLTTGARWPFSNSDEGQLLLMLKDRTGSRAASSGCFLASTLNG